MNKAEYGVYVTIGEKGYDPKTTWGGDHITVARTQKVRCRNFSKSRKQGSPTYDRQQKMH